MSHLWHNSNIDDDSRLINFLNEIVNYFNNLVKTINEKKQS